MKEVILEEKKDCTIILKILFQNDKEKLEKLYSNLDLKFSFKELRSRLIRMSNSIKICSTSVPEIEKWLESLIKIKFTKQFVSHDKNDFLIYLMKCAGENVNFTIGQSSSSGTIKSVPAEILEKNPCLSYVIAL